ncbi:MAG: hypothetical protein CFK49_06820 [Armatimonadetes bacterium JP3_11]|jgi:hypothetical protein|nr:MAG: hypothetical protein CFK48_02260 [Armatimonadetes bacterium CP1_7O]OYT74745.1 MAG: hypothetical protein CFK49_06820 [Armatimonadetes bacterium JP3_11]RMH10716.1 MAG: hypothetical protein D6697_00385 [Armatimonadota bacterium]
MPFTVEDINELIRIIEANPELKRALQERLVDAEAIQRALRDPEKRNEIRRAVLGEEWEDIPTILRQLAEGQQRHEAILQEHTQQLAMLIESQQRHEAILQEHTQILQEHSQILQEHSQILQEHSQILQEHSQILQEHTRQLAMLIETQQRHEAILEQHTAQLNRLESEFQSLRNEFRGLAGRFDGAEYERRTRQRATAIFNGGSGGSPDNPAVRRRLKQWLRAAFGEIPFNGDLDDVFMSDIIWWKNGTVIVGEISVKVDRLDVVRAKQRAELLRHAGVNAIPVVIGDDWAMEETRELAQSEGVEWLVAKQYSEKILEFRRLPEAAEDED